MSDTMYYLLSDLFTPQEFQIYFHIKSITNKKYATVNISIRDISSVLCMSNHTVSDAIKLFIKYGIIELHQPEKKYIEDGKWKVLAPQYKIKDYQFFQKISSQLKTRVVGNKRKILRNMKMKRLGKEPMYSL